MYIHSPTLREGARWNRLAPQIIWLQHDAETQDTLLRLDATHAVKYKRPRRVIRCKRAISNAQIANACPRSSASKLAHSGAGSLATVYPNTHSDTHPSPRLHASTPTHPHQPERLYPASHPCFPNAFLTDTPCLPCCRAHPPPSVHLRPTAVQIHERPISWHIRHRHSHLLFPFRRQAGKRRRIQCKESEDRPINTSRLILEVNLVLNLWGWSSGASANLSRDGNKRCFFSVVFLLRWIMNRHWLLFPERSWYRLE